ncbi:MAG: GNAT family N-acetyltransferase [Bosea sp. (in: a-proteobacteria)]
MTPTDVTSSEFSPPQGREPLFRDLARDDVFRLETTRLWLRWPRMSDAALLTECASDRRVAEMTARLPHPYPANRAEMAIFDMRKGNALGESLVLALANKDKPDGFLGVIGVRPGEDGQPVLGYWVGMDHWGLGFATEAAQAMIDAAFTLTATDALHASARVINPASRRVLEKCGFRHEGSKLQSMPARGGVFPCDEFRLDRKTWAALRNWAALKSWSGELAAEAAVSRAQMPQLVVV